MKGKINKLFDAIKNLHRRKDAAYGHSWKRRGELVSIVANVARKVDRIEEFNSKGVNLLGESILDTAVDLFVYLIKYRLFLLEQCSQSNTHMPKEAPQPFSNHTENFDWIVDALQIPEFGESPGLSGKIVSAFDDLFKAASANGMPVLNRLRLVDELSNLTLQYILQILDGEPDLLESLNDGAHK